MTKHESLGDQKTRYQPGPEDKTPPPSHSDTSFGDISTASDLALGEVGDSDDRDAAEGNRYERLELIGQGGMGQVFRARDNRLNRHVALKCIRTEATSSRRANERFRREAQAIAALNHAGIVQVYDYGRDDDGPFIVMELVEGRSLDALLREDGPLEPAKVVELGVQVCDALAVAHDAGIIHRDIKPANILVTPRGDAKLSDFGLALSAAPDGARTQAGVVLGTIDFMPPEQRADPSAVGPASDVWSLAATLYQAVTGKSPRVIRGDKLPTTLAPALLQALDDDRAERFASADDFRAALLEVKLDVAAVTASHRVEGRCPACNRVNPLECSFCEGCGAALSEPCLNCGEEIRVWAAHCGSCGINVAQETERRLAEIAKEKQEIESLRRNRDYPQAMNRLSRLAEIDHSRLSEAVGDLDSLRHSLKTEAEDTKRRIDELILEARGLAESGQYTRARVALQRIPGPLRDEPTRALVAECTRNAEMIEAVKRDIESAKASKDFEQLSEHLQSYLVLCPGDDRAREYLRSLEAKLLGRRIREQFNNGQFAEAIGGLDRYLELSPGDEKASKLRSRAIELQREQRKNSNEKFLGIAAVGGGIVVAVVLVVVLAQAMWSRDVKSNDHVTREGVDKSFAGNSIDPAKSGNTKGPGTQSAHRRAALTPSPEPIPAIRQLKDIHIDEGVAAVRRVSLVSSIAPYRAHFQLVNAPTGAEIDAQTGDFKWQSGEADGPGVYHVRVRVSVFEEPERFGESTFSIHVSEVNRPPTISTGPMNFEFEILPGGQLRIPFTFSDEDLPQQRLVVRGSVGTDETLLVDTDKGVATWYVPHSTRPGVYTVRLVVEDPRGATAHASVLVTVRNPSWRGLSRGMSMAAVGRLLGPPHEKSADGRIWWFNTRTTDQTLGGAPRSYCYFNKRGSLIDWSGHEVRPDPTTALSFDSVLWRYREWFLLRKGMSADEVRDLIGSPTGERGAEWIYNDRALGSAGAVYFEQGRLLSWYLPIGATKILDR